MKDRTEFLRVVAIHESGHAVSAWALGLPFGYVSIRRSSEGLGRVNYGFSQAMLNIGRRGFTRELRDHVISTMAGPVAEAKYTGIRHDDHAGSDDRSVYTVLRGMYGERMHLEHDKLLRTATKLINKEWTCVLALAGELIQCREMTQSDAVSIMERAK